MSKVVRLSDSTLEVIENLRKYFIDTAPDLVTRKKFEDCNEDDFIRPVLEAFKELNIDNKQGQ